MKREELEEIPMIGWECYDKEEADSVMDAMEQQIRTLENDKEAMYEANLVQQARIKELEAENKHLDDYIDAYQTSEALNIEKLDKKDERIKELEAQCTKYQAELMNNDPALNPTISKMETTAEESSAIEKEK